jgi:hypothetical protein
MRVLGNGRSWCDDSVVHALYKVTPQSDLVEKSSGMKFSLARGFMEQEQELTFAQACACWSPIGQEAFRLSSSIFSFFGNEPRGIEASFPAQYMVLWANQDKSMKLTLAHVDRRRKAEGYIGRGAIDRYETEVLLPMVHSIEARYREQQVEAENIADLQFLADMGISL